MLHVLSSGTEVVSDVIGGGDGGPRLSVKLETSVLDSTDATCDHDDDDVVDGGESSTSDVRRLKAVMLPSVS